MKKFYIAIPFLFSLFILAACGKADEGEKCVDAFFKYAVNEKYDRAANLLELEGVERSAYDSIVESFVNTSDIGKLVGAKKQMGFNTNVSNGITTVVLPYSLKYEKETMERSVTVVDRGKGFRIVSIE